MRGFKAKTLQTFSNHGLVFMDLHQVFSSSKSVVLNEIVELVDIFPDNECSKHSFIYLHEIVYP